jgi:hypothetical protein
MAVRSGCGPARGLRRKRSDGKRGQDDAQARGDARTGLDRRTSAAQQQRHAKRDDRGKRDAPPAAGGEDGAVRGEQRLAALLQDE